MVLYSYTAPKNYSNPIAYWDPVARIGGGGSLSYTTTYGVTNHQEEILSTSFSTSVTNTLTAGVEFEGIGISDSLSATVSSEITATSIESVTKTQITQTTYTCDEGQEALYQWVVAMTEHAMVDTKDFEIRSTYHWCVSDDSLTPQCLPGYCADDDCQYCTIGSNTMEPSITTSTKGSGSAKDDASTSGTSSNLLSDTVIIALIGASALVLIVLIIAGFICYTKKSKENQRNYVELNSTQDTRK